MQRVLLLLLATGFLSAANANTGIPFAHDRDLTGDVVRIFEEVPVELAPDAVEVIGADVGVSYEVVRLVHGQPIPVEGLQFSFSGDCSSDFSGNSKVEGQAVLATDFFSVSTGSENYRIVFQADCGTRVRLVFDSASYGGQALGIWQIAHTALVKLDQAVGLGFWQEPIPLVWPAEGDYYSWGTVHVARGDHWDVVGHELGHAIYDQAKIGAWGGGEHRIDQCYSHGLALSEGWASYFSAWLSIDLADADAKFEYMVPRRAPIRIEDVPQDVCAGSKNEWRVTAFFWDLIDLNDDGETSTEEFAGVWNVLANSRSSSADQAARKLIEAGMTASAVSTAWQLSFLEPL